MSTIRLPSRVQTATILLGIGDLMKRCAICLAALVAVFLSAIQGLAQDNGLKAIDIKGTVEEFNNFQMKVKSSEGAMLTVLLTQLPAVEYKGSADSKALLPGQFIRLTGSFDSMGNLEGNLEEVEIFRPKTGRMRPDDRQRQTPGIYPLDAEAKGVAAGNAALPQNGQANPPNNAREAAKTKPSKPAKPSKAKPAESDKSAGAAATPVQFEKYMVVGQIANIQGNKVLINTGNQALNIQIADSTKVKVSFPDLELCVKGDEVQVVGLGTDMQPDLVQARSLLITAAKPLTLGANQNVRNAAIKNSAGKAEAKTDAKNDKTNSKVTGKK
jgi:hypothetical protein